jgi:ferredoxin/flavodoxin---NADP+ reductase
MTFVITQNCCTDASCVPVCPVDCIRPVPGGDGVTAPMLYIDPQTCVDCGACVEVCPVEAIYHEDELPDSQARFKDINADYFAAQPLAVRPTTPITLPDGLESGSLRVAVVGTGPAACYAISDLVRTSGVEVNVFERLPTPFGLVRFGVAPDHQRTKDIVGAFESALADDDVNCFFNVAVGDDISHDELVAHHHAVIYAVGTSHSRDLTIPGAELPGNHAAADVVGWYNGHPEHARHDLDLSGPRVVVIGNGNVALDVARVLVMNLDDLAATDIAEHALDRLRDSAVEEVVILGRRGPADAAFSAGELLALGHLRDVDVVIEGDLGDRPEGFERALKYDVISEFAARPTRLGNRRIVLRFGTRPVEFVGDGRVEGVVIADNGGTSTLATPLVLRSIGYRGSAIDGLPFDDKAGVIPNTDGRVIHGNDAIAGVYVTGWIKRGPRGVIGTNRTCALETVTNLLADFHAGRLPTDVGDTAALRELLASRQVKVIDWSGWRSIDAYERQRGSDASRPRVKVVDVEALLTAAAAC